MTESVARAWPETALNPVQCLRIVAAGLPHVALVEAVIDAPLERVWDLVGDLVNGAPQFERGVRSAQILKRDGDYLELAVRTALGLRVDYEVELRFGFCLMESRYSQVGMAAIEVEPGRSTRFAHFEGSRLLGRFGVPLFRWNCAGDMRRIARILKSDSDDRDD